MIHIKDNKERTVTLHGVLTDIGGKPYLDTTLGDGESMPEAAAIHVVPIHLLWRVDIEGKDLRLVPPRAEWFDAQQKNVTLQYPRIRIDDWIVLSGNSTELRRMVAEHASEKGFFDDETFKEPWIKVEPKP